MPTKKMVYSSEDKLYMVVQKGQDPYPAQAEDQKIKDVLQTAEDSLKKVFDSSPNPSVHSGVKIAVVELF
jgi:hypothetical protein